MTIKPGTVHLEFGTHLKKEDATKRLRKRLQPPPKHFLIEGVSYGREAFPLALSEQDFVEKARAAHERNTSLMELLSKGLPANMKGNPYGKERERLIIQANSPKPQMKVYMEPFNEKAARHFYKYITTRRTFDRHVEAGELNEAMAAYSQGFQHWGEALRDREKSIINAIATLHSAHPDDSILVDLGTSHSHITQILQAKGIPTTSRTVGELTGTQTKLHSQILRAEQGLGEQPTPEKKEQALRRGFIMDIVLTQLGYEKTVSLESKLSKPEVDELIDHLAKAKGENLEKRAITWLKAREKL